MTLYVASSAMAKRYLAEHDTTTAVALIESDPVLVTSRITEIEVRRTLTRVLDGEDLLSRREAFAIDLDGFALMPVDAFLCNRAASIAEQHLCKSRDAVHIASAQRADANSTFLTFDVKQAAAAREVGLHVLGA